MVTVCKIRVNVYALWFRMDTASMSWKNQKIHEDRINMIFIFAEKPHMAIDEGWIKEEDGVRIQLDLPCFVFEENESEVF